MNKLTRKECEQACLYLLSHCYEVEHIGKEKYIFTPSGFSEAEVFKNLIENHFNNSHLRLYDRTLNKICIYDEVSFYSLKGTVGQCCGAYGIFFDDITWDFLEGMIKKETGCDNQPSFCYCDNFISFWEIHCNYNCEENYFPMIEITRKGDKNK